NVEIIADRASVLARLAGARPAEGQGLVVVTTVSAILQRVPPREVFAGTTLSFRRGGTLDLEKLTAFLTAHGFNRTGTVREPGEFAVRGGLIDLFPPGAAEPVRLDLFGQSIESIRGFDPLSQKTTGTRESFALAPVSELVLDEARITLFRERYRAANPQDWRNDPLYEAVSAGQRFVGMEQWLPHFYGGLETLFHYLPGAAVTTDHQVDQAVEARFELIADYYEARRSMAAGSKATAEKTSSGEFVYRPVPPGSLYLDKAEWKARLGERRVAAFSPFAVPEGAKGVIDAGYRQAPDFSAARNQGDVNLFDEVRKTLVRYAREGARPVVAAFTAGSRARLAQLLREHGAADVQEVSDWAAALAAPRGAVSVAELALEHGILSAAAAIVTEQDILGERLVRRAKKRRRTDAFITELSSLQPVDLVVHEDHGIGRYDGLETLTALGAPHDCLRLVYAGGDKLYLPVENIELLSRYGSESGDAQLDKLGGAGWQSRKARIKKRIAEIADKLIAIAAQRQLKTAEAVQVQPGSYDEFSARFAYTETEDQQKAIEDVVGDLASGRPMDRLVCGDVGFGKTEVALRAAFVAVHGGKQVAILAPTTLLAEQHYQTLTDRFAQWPVKVAELSRFRSAKEVKAALEGLAAGRIDIVVGTHKLLSADVKFARLGLLIVDEEHRFGVRHKEAIKALRAEVDVLTLTATPIPRTLGMALEGLRDLSVIATAPQRRLAIKTFVRNEGSGVIREAVLRELKRGGQVYFLHNEVETIEHRRAKLAELVPEARIAVAHGQMPERELERVMRDFVAQRHNLLLCSTIIETGIDVPSANTIVISRADKFGLAQLHQLRGRVGRSHHQAYAYLLVPEVEGLSKQAAQRLQAIQDMEELGSGFYLAMHDLEIRGAGEVLGDSQSGNIMEVGFQLYNDMLAEAVSALKAGREPDLLSPLGGLFGAATEVNLHAPALLPDSYCPDVHQRLSLYKRLALAEKAADIDALLEEITDRFGKLPVQGRTLFDTHRLRVLARPLGVHKIDAAPRQMALSFRPNPPIDAARIIELVQKNRHIRLAGNDKLRVERELADPKDRAQFMRDLLRSLGRPVAAAG
ncbi:MAG: transcription-repair coupling factor, partial [Rubrivivax sp.]|nr:transcription-repair coupling factor [Rubrivivax sp.]